MQSLWAEFVRSRAFWLSYLSPGLDLRGCPSLHSDNTMLWKEPGCGTIIHFDFSDSHSLEFPEFHLLQLEISLDGHRLTHIDDNVNYDTPQEIGNMSCHQASDLFRWDEFQAIVRHLAKRCSPVWAIEFLFSMYIAVTPDIADDYVALLSRCVEASEVFTSPEAEYILAGYRGKVLRDFRWVDTPGIGWVAEGGHSARNRSYDYWKFDFARFDRLLRALAQNANHAL